VRVCYFGAYRQEYARNRIMIAGLRRNGIAVIECHEQLWHSIEDRVGAIAGGWQRPAFWWRVVRTYLRLLRRYWTIRHDYDLLITGYPGQFDVLLARLLSWWQGKPLVWDVFMSIYLIALERGLDQQNGFVVGVVRRFEWLACRLSDRLILDTAEYAAWFQQTHGVALERFRLVPTGADSDQFHSIPTPPKRDDGFTVIYYGTFIPNHGVKTIVEAAHLLAAEPDVHFALIGQGPDRAAAVDLAQRYGLTNLTFIDWLEQPALIQQVAAADLCLGAFGTTPQSLMTVQNKIYEGLALGKAVLSGDGPAVRNTLQHGAEIYLCERANPQALATAIRTLRDDSDLRHKLAETGRKRFEANFTIEALGKLYKAHLMELV
jgi:glycosyltransferase involved in cell wall biosynthesis